MKKHLSALIGLAAMGAMMDSNPATDAMLSRSAEPRRILLTKAQKKVRSANKRSRKARRLQRRLAA